ncbi:NADP-dependent oxidoreductase domain-containing protein [Syncephalis fuscata]|nr:NADP-dependent oxidoreductase domain-containing protein [Syncephalis fuscata]
MLQKSLERLKVQTIDIYYQYRIDPKVLIETTGKVRYLDLSECSAKILHCAHKVHPIAAIQLGIAIVAYLPLDRGFLTGNIRNINNSPEGGWRCINPRF